MIDVHTHILPGMDDGSRSAEESVAMLEKISGMGIHHVAVTPHFYADRESPDMFLKRRTASEQMLREAMGNRQDLPQIHPGAEIRYYDGFSRMELLPELRIRDTNALLLEMPFMRWSDRMFSEIQFVQDRFEFQVILAHIERYLEYQNHHTFWDKVQETGAVVQSNADFFISRRTRRKALHLLKAEKIQILASDCHRIDRRIPNLEDAMALVYRHLGSAPAEKMESLQNYLFNFES